MEIMREIERITDGQMRIGLGKLYSSIRQMLEAGLIIESDERSAHAPCTD